MLKIYTLINQNKKAAIVIGLIILGIISFLASRITLEEDITSLIPSGEQQNTLKKVLDQTEFSDKIIITVSADSSLLEPEDLIQYAQQFIDSIDQELPEYVEQIQGKVPEEGIREIYDFVYQHIPLFLNESDYSEIEKRLDKDSLKDRLRENYKSLISPTGLVTKQYLFKDPLSISALGLKKLEELQVGEDFELYNNFLVTKDHKHLLLFLSPKFPASETNKNTIFVERLEEIQSRLNKEFKGISGEFFGGVRYSVANANQIKKDIQLTLGIATIILLSLLIFYYKRIYVPILLFIPSVIGAISALAILYLIKGNISAISVGIGAVLLGISIDYALHILTHYRNNNNIPKLYKEVTRPVLMSSSTTAVAFLCLIFVKSKALNDLGIFAAISVMVASVLALILIPQLYKIPKGNGATSSNFIDKLASIEFHKKKPLALIIFILFITGLFFFTKIKFNNDLSALNYEPHNIKQAEQHVHEIAGKAAKSIYLVSYGNTVDEALEFNNELYTKLTRLKKNNEILNYSSIGGVVLSTNTQLEKIERWKVFWPEHKKQLIQEDLIEQSDAFGFRPESFNTFYELLSSEFNPIYLKDYSGTTNLYLDDFISSKENFATVTTSVSVNEEDIPRLIKEFKSVRNVVVIDRKQINQNFLGHLRSDFNILIGYSIIAVFLILLLAYRSIEISVLTLIPIGITWVIALGIMSILGIEFNILNIIISTFIFGLGLDYSIFITNAFLKEYETGTKVLITYRTSIILSVFTTLLGIGALFFAKHPALESISLVSIIGVLSAVLVAFILQSYFLNMLFLERIARGKPAFNIRTVLLNIFDKKSIDKLYYKNLVLDNYRYKSVFPTVKKLFESQKERYLKLSGFIENKETVINFYSGCGLLEIFLGYKNTEITITGIEPDINELVIAQNCFASRSSRLHFHPSVPEEAKKYDVVIISKIPTSEMEKEIRKMVNRYASKVIILDPKYSYRWIIDLNFQIDYRQNDVVVLKKME